jgi:hypothetical protein
MVIDSSDHLARTIEFQTALVHISGEFAGVIEVPIFVGQSSMLHSDLEELTLQLEGEPHLLRPVRREYFAGQLRLMYFSKHLHETRRMPSALQLHWGESAHEDSCGMELLFKIAGEEEPHED